MHVPAIQHTHYLYNMYTPPITHMFRGPHKYDILTKSGHFKNERLLYSLTLKFGVNLLNASGIKHIASKCACDFDCEWQRVNAVFYCVSLTHVLLQIISYSDTNVPVLVVMGCKRASVLHVYELIFLLHTSRSTEYRGEFDIWI